MNFGKWIFTWNRKEFWMEELDWRIELKNFEKKEEKNKNEKGFCDGQLFFYQLFNNFLKLLLYKINILDNVNMVNF